MKTFITIYTIASLIVLFSIFYYCCDGGRYIRSQIKEIKTTRLRASTYKEAVKLISELEIHNNGDIAEVTLDSGTKLIYIFKEK